jgi:hypothetical protein
MIRCKTTSRMWTWVASAVLSLAWPVVSQATVAFTYDVLPLSAGSSIQTIGIFVNSVGTPQAVSVANLWLVTGNTPTSPGMGGYDAGNATAGSTAPTISGVDFITPLMVNGTTYTPLFSGNYSSQLSGPQFFGASGSSTIMVNGSSVPYSSNTQSQVWNAPAATASGTVSIPTTPVLLATITIDEQYNEQDTTDDLSSWPTGIYYLTAIDPALDKKRPSLDESSVGLGIGVAEPAQAMFIIGTLPEPGTLALFGLALPGLLLRRRRAALVG